MDTGLEEYIEAAEAMIDNDADFPAKDMINGVGAMLVSEWGAVQAARQSTEERWLCDLRQYRGIYEADELANMGKDKARIFARKTRVKVRTLDARMLDLLYPAGNQRNWDIKETPDPSIPDEDMTRIIEELRAAKGSPPMQAEVDAQVSEFVSERAAAMRRTIDDNLSELNMRKMAKVVLHSGHLYGVGILKGPLTTTKTVTRFRASGQAWEEIEFDKKSPHLSYVPVWDWYPDMAHTELETMPAVFERHRFTRSGLAELQKQEGFDAQALADYINANPKGLVEPKHWEQDLRSIGERDSAMDIAKGGLYEVIERWGFLNADDLMAAGLIEFSEPDRHRHVFCNAWFFPSGVVVKFDVFEGLSIRDIYKTYTIDPDETTIFSEGIPSIMRDEQVGVNSVTRMILDNGAACAGPQAEVNVKLLSSLTKVDSLRPFKLWLRNGEEPGHRAVIPIDFASHLGDLAHIRAMFEDNIDEVTTIPRYMTGENVGTGAAGTARGMSMLMGAAAMVIKDLAAEYDEGITKPIVSGLYKWNMDARNNPDPGVKGDFEAVALAASSLVAKELRLAELANFAASIQPEERPYVRWYGLLRARVTTAELGDAVIVDETKAEEIDNNQAALAQQKAMQELSDLQLNKLREQIEEIRAKRVATNLGTAYAAIQAGGVAVANPAAAAAGDEMLRSVEFPDAALKQPPQPQQLPPQEEPPPQSPFAGLHKGMRTDEIEPIGGPPVAG